MVFKSCSSPPILFKIRPEPLHEVSLFVQMTINSPRRVLILSGRKHSSPALFLDGIDQGLAVVLLVSDPNLERNPFDLLLGMRHVCIMTRSQDQPDWQPKPDHSLVDVGPKIAATAASYGNLVRLSHLLWGSDESRRLAPRVAVSGQPRRIGSLARLPSESALKKRSLAERVTYFPLRMRQPQRVPVSGPADKPLDRKAEESPTALRLPLPS